MGRNIYIQHYLLLIPEQKISSVVLLDCSFNAGTNPVRSCEQRDRDGEKMLTSYLKLLFSWATVGSSEIIQVWLSFGVGTALALALSLPSVLADALRDHLPPAFEIRKEKDLLSF